MKKSTFNTEIQNRVINSILSNGVKTDKIAEMVKRFTDSTDDSLRVSLYLTGGLTIPELPQQVRMDRYIAILKDYDVFTDTVSYTYDEERHYFFDSEERAKAYSESGDYDYSHYYSSKKDNYQFEGVHIFKDRNGDTPLYLWLSREVVEPERTFE